MLYLMGFKNPECVDYARINDPDYMYVEIEKAVKKYPVYGGTAYAINDFLKKAGFDFGKDYWMKKTSIGTLTGFVFKIKLLHEDCYREIESHLGSSLANSMGNDAYHNCQDTASIIDLLEQYKFKENKHYNIGFFSKSELPSEELVGIELSGLYRKLEDYYQEGDYELLKNTYPKVYEIIYSFDRLDRMPSMEEVRTHEKKWKGFFERQGRIKDGLW